MIDRNTCRLALFRRFRDMVTGSLPGILLCMLTVCGTGNEKAGAATGSFLAPRDITLIGRVTAPSCTVRLENSRMQFGSVAPGQPRRDAPQQLNIAVSECDADGVGLLLKAEHWPDMPQRGILRSVPGREVSDSLYYTVAPGQESDEAWPLVAVREHAQQGQQPAAQRRENDDKPYFLLSAVRYWYNLKFPMKEGDERIIPLTVTVHQASGSVDKTAQEELNGTFTIELSWR